jgi:hypothetical protein
MKKHPTMLTTMEPSVDMGRQIMGLRYDLILPILTGMLQECNRQCTNDALSGRTKLAFELEKMSDAIDSLITDASAVVRRCRPYIDEEKKA